MKLLFLSFILLLGLQACLPKSGRIARRQYYHEKSARILTAHYEGTQSFNKISLYENNRFYTQSIGMWTTGDWIKKGDTLIFTYDNVRDSFVGTKALISGKGLYVIGYNRDRSMELKTRMTLTEVSPHTSY